MLLPKKYKKVTPELAIKTDRIDNVYLEGQSEPRNIFEVREFDVEEIYQGDNAIKGDVEVTDRENGITQDEQSNK